MPLRTYFTVDAAFLVEQTGHPVERAGIKLNILVNNKTDIQPGLFTLLASLENEFIVSLSASLLQDGENLPVICRQLYLMLALNNSPSPPHLVPVFTNAEQNEPLPVSHVKAYLTQQGLQGVKFPVFSYAATGVQTIDNCSLIRMSGQTAWPNGFPLDYDNSTTLIIASPGRNIGGPEIADLWKQASSDRVMPEPGISRLCADREEFETEKELWKKRALLYQDFLSLSKKVQEKEYYEVINWYQKEYEILPTWYKRFGHIIKVMTGKRRFRSLFSDKVKKEKE